MYKCDNCNKKFEEPLIINTSYESYYGVSDLFPNCTQLLLEVCPNCRDDSITELKMCDECLEWAEYTYIGDNSENLCEKCYEKYIF